MLENKIHRFSENWFYHMVCTGVLSFFLHAGVHHTLETVSTYLQDKGYVPKENRIEYPSMKISF